MRSVMTSAALALLVGCTLDLGSSGDGSTNGGGANGGAGSGAYDAGANDAGAIAEGGAGDAGAATGDASSDASAPGADAAPPQPGAPGYLHTQGAQILDSQNHVVRLTGLSWFGMETSNFAPHGLWSRSMASMLDQIAQLGFNMIRVPFTNQMFDSGSVPNGVDANQNPALQGKKPIEILDALVAGAKQRGLRVVLDRHRPDASGQSPLWYTSTVSEQRWVDDWKMLAQRYKGDPTVIGVDLHNEPHGSASWGDGNMQTDWRLAAERAGAAVQSVNPDLLIIVEGVEQAGGASYWWGGNLRNAGASPVRLPVANHLVYSPHDYPASVFAQTWFMDPAYPANLPTVWDASWGYLAKTGVAPIWIGEFGTKNQTTVDQKWFSGLSAYAKDRGLSFAFWCLNPDSGDTGGILADDWQTVNTDKMNVLRPALAPRL